MPTTRRRVSAKKELPPVAPSKSSNPRQTTEENSSNSDDNILNDELSTQKGRHFWYVVYPSKEWIEKNIPKCEYDGSSGYGTAPDDWMEQLRLRGFNACVSPLHDRDKNPDGTYKKPHWHLIVSWGNTTTYRNAMQLAEFLCSPRPQMLSSVTGAYRYHQHLDNPEKYQYKEPNTVINEWEKPIDNTEKNRIKLEIIKLMFTEQIKEYAELVIACNSIGADLFDVVTNNTVFFNSMLASFRNKPVMALKRYHDTLVDGEEKSAIEHVLWEQYGVEQYKPKTKSYQVTKKRISTKIKENKHEGCN